MYSNNQFFFFYPRRAGVVVRNNLERDEFGMEDMEGYFSESSTDEHEKLAHQEQSKITSSVTKILSANGKRLAPMIDTPTRRNKTNDTIESMDISKTLTPTLRRFGSNSTNARGMHKKLFTTPSLVKTHINSPPQRLSSSVTPRIKKPAAPSATRVLPPRELPEVNEDEDIDMNNDSFMDIEQDDVEYSPPPFIPSVQQQVEDEDVVMSDADFGDNGVGQDKSVLDDSISQQNKDDEDEMPRHTTKSRRGSKAKAFSFHDSEEDNAESSIRSPTPTTQPIPETDEEEELDEVEIEMYTTPVSKRSGATTKNSTHPSKGKTTRRDGQKAPAVTASNTQKITKGKIAKKPAISKVTAGGSPRKSVSTKTNAPLISAPPEPASRQISEELTTPGVRRSKRIRVAPLEFWKNERIIYSLDDTADERPKIKTIIQVDESAAREMEAAKRQALSEARKRAAKKSKKTTTGGATKSKKQSQGDQKDEKTELDQKILANLRKKGTLVEKTFLEASVFPYPPENGERQDQLIAWGREYPLRAAKGGAHQVASLFDADAHFAAAGLLALAPHTNKPQKSSKHNHYFFFVASGAVHVVISDVEFTVVEGGSFVVPRGNTYSLANALPDQDVRMFFVQCTDTLSNEQNGVKRKK